MPDPYPLHIHEVLTIHDHFGTLVVVSLCTWDCWFTLN